MTDPSTFIGLTPLEREAIGLSLKVGATAVASSLPFGIVVAWLLARHRFIGKTLFDGLIHLPLIVPPVVIGYLLLVLLGRRGPIGGWLFDTFGVTLAFTWKGAAIAAAVMAFPLMVRAIRLSVEAVDRRRKKRPVRWVPARCGSFSPSTLPLSLPGVVAGTVLAFARCLGEFGATITFVSNIPGETRTLPLALYTLTQVPDGDAPALRLVVISVVLALAALVASEALARRVSPTARE